MVAVNDAAGARTVLLSAPGKGVDATIVLGVDDDSQLRRVDGQSAARRVRHPARVMTTVHAYTDDQNILDASHKNPRRARFAAMDIIPTATGRPRRQRSA